MQAFLVRRGGPHALALVGGAGIGKTTLWEEGVRIAGPEGMRVLRARPDADAVEVDARFERERQAS